MRTNFTAAQKQEVMGKLMQSSQGRAKLAFDMQGPLRNTRNYSSVGRRAFFIEELGDGQIPVYDRDVDTPAYVVGENGDSIQTVQNVQRIMIPLFEMASYPKIGFMHVKERRFDAVKRIKEKTKFEIFRREDRIIFEMMKLASEENKINEIITVERKNFTMDMLVEAFGRVERHNLRVDKVFMNPQEFTVIRSAGRDYLDFQTQREILRTGLMATLYGAEILQSMEVPPGSIFIVTEPEYFGYMPIRIDLTVLPADDMVNRAFGWSVFQALGIGIHNAAFGLQEVRVV